MKYQTELAELVKLLPTTQNILIALPATASVDELAAGLALMLSLQQAGKEVSIVTEGVIRVGHTNLFGVGEIQSKVPEGKGGDYVITLGGVAATGPDGQGSVPSLEKLDYYTKGSDLHLVFKVLPGQKFEPTGVTPRYEGGGFGLIFILGATTLAELGGIYTANPQLFSGTHLVNIDNSQGNTRFGSTVLIDPAASSVSEMISQALSALGLPVNGDIATNILSGIFSATAGLQERNAGADTYEAVAAAIRVGGQRPAPGSATAQVSGTTAVPVPAPAAEPATPSQGIDFSKIFQAPVSTPAESFTVPPVVSSIPQLTQSQSAAEPGTPSGEEAVVGEEVVTPEEDWLTPKIFKGKGSIG